MALKALSGLWFLELSMGREGFRGWGRAGFCASGWSAPGKRGNQVYLVAIAEDLLRVGLTPVDHKENGIVAMRQHEAVEHVGQGASGRKRHVKPAQGARRRASLQRRVQMNTDGDFYQLKILSRSDSAAS